MTPDQESLLQVISLCLKRGNPCTASNLVARGFTWEQIERALQDEIIAIPEDMTLSPIAPLTPTRLDSELWNKVARATRIPTPRPSFDKDRGLYHWPDSATQGQFAVQLIGLRDGQPAARLVPIDSQRNVLDPTGKCWERDVTYRGPHEIQHACRDAHLMNQYAAEGGLDDDPPWVHPADELPLSQRKP